MNRVDIQLSKGATLSESISIESNPALPCEMYLDIRLSPMGRRFARLSSSAGQLVLASTGDGDRSVKAFANAAVFQNLPALDYQYTLHAKCAKRNWVLAEGSFELLPDSFHDSTLAWTGDLSPITNSALFPSIWSGNEALNICCDQAQPLYFEFSAPGGLGDIVVDAEYGKWWLESYQGGEWHYNASRTPMYNRDGSDVQKHRIVYVRFPQWSPKTSKWGKGWYKGGTDDCSSCGCCDDECRGFHLDIFVTDALGQKTHAEFAVSVDGEQPEAIVTAELVVEGCTDNVGAVDMSAQAGGLLVADGCSLTPSTISLVSGGSPIQFLNATGCSLAPGQLELP